MNKKQYSLTVALIAGLVGGVISGQFFVGRPVFAEKKKDWKVIEANEFRVVSSKGDLLATFHSEEGRFIPKGKKKPVDGPLMYGPRLVMYSGFGEDKKKSLILRSDGISTKNISAFFAQFMTLNIQQILEDLELREIAGKLSIPIDKYLPGFHVGRLIIDATRKDGATVLEIFDKESNLRAALGTIELKHKDTGSTETRAPSSLVLFDEKGNVVWKAP